MASTSADDGERLHVRLADRVPLADLAHDLGQRAEALCRWLGLAGRVQGRTLLALNPVRGDRLPGSFRIELHGSKAGLWIDWATGDRFSAEAGDALDLIAYIPTGFTHLTVLLR